MNNIYIFSNTKNSKHKQMALDATTIAYNQMIQGVMLGELALTLFLYLLLKFIHYIVWGFDDTQEKEKKDTGADQNKEGDEPDERKWDQAGFNIYFPLIFGYHIVALGVPLLYMPHTFSAIVAWIHFGLFIGLLIVNIFIKKDLQEGKGSRTTVSRILWGLMCLMNIILVIGGLAGVNQTIG